MSLRMDRYWYLLFLTVCFFYKPTYSSLITIDNNRYKGVTVAIHKDTPEDDALITNIKILFSKASEFLYNSTKKGVYFKEVTIVVPSTWSTRDEYEILPGNFFSSAHVRVDAANPEYENAPYTLQPGGCGEPGQFIHLTPWFIKELHGKTVDMFGAPEKQLVHEWAHLRYGVFDEYGVPGDKRYPMFYHENGKIRATSCVRDIKGWIESRDGGPCSLADNGEVDEDCIFIPNMHSNEAKASIMYMPFIPSIEGFCDDAEHKHNIRAPTKHNAICNYRSTWDVISHHADFQTTRTKRDAASELTETLFRIIQSPKNPVSRYVLVLDVSGSMDGQPMVLLHRAATRLVEDRIPNGTFLGIVQFSTEASILQNLTKVDDKTRMHLSRSLPSKDDGGRTAIGKGLREAINVLKHDSGRAEAGLIMLITDGEENVTPFIEDVLPEILENKVIINAVAFGSEASDKLENVTTITGGRGYFFSNMNGSRPTSALDSAFLESVTSQADIELQPVQLKDEMFPLDNAETIKSVYVDDELGKNTIFTVTSPHIQRVESVQLKSPSNAIYSSSDPEYSRDDSLRQRIQITFPYAQPGKWELTILRHGDYPVIVGFSVTSEPKDVRDQPIRVRSWLNEVQLKFPAYAKVYAEVKKGYRAVIGANVIATVERPMGAAIDVELRDDGLGADVTENDGIYTGYFTHFNGNGRYAVMARVSNDGQARLKQGSRSSGSQPMPQLKGASHDLPMGEFVPAHFVPVERNETEEQQEETKGEPTSNFDRTSNSGAFRVDSWKPDAGDVIPPGDILDLVILSAKTSQDRSEVTLQWTTPGDDLDVGQVSSLDLRGSRTIEDFLIGFENGFRIDDSYVINGSLAPEPPGSKQQLILFLPQNLQGNFSEAWSVYFALKAVDDANMTSSKFNIASATFGVEWKVPREGSSDDHATEQMTARESTGNKNSFKWWPLAVGIGAAIFVVMLVALVSVIIFKKTKTKSYSSVQREHC